MTDSMPNAISNESSQDFSDFLRDRLMAAMEAYEAAFIKQQQEKQSND